MPKILVDNVKTTMRTRNIIWAVGAMYRGSFNTEPEKAEWIVEEPRWLVSAETARQAVREIARENADDLSRNMWDDRSQRCLFIMPWDHYRTDRVAPGADIEETNVGLNGDQVVRYHRRWS